MIKQLITLSSASLNQAVTRSRQQGVGSFRSAVGYLMAGCVVALACQSAHAEAVTGPVGTYTTPEGETYFSMSLSLNQEAPASDAGRDVVVLFDTSASQTGEYRTTALAALRSCLNELNAQDRVQVMAVDLQARPLNAELAPADSRDVAQALQALEAQSPLGSTDMQAALNAAAQTLASSPANERVVLYLGDGMSTANLMGTSSAKQLMKNLRDNRIAVSSYAIGPQRDNQLLAVLANQTGGNVYVDEPMTQAEPGVSASRASQENLRRGERIGRILADWTHAQVAWPESSSTSVAIEASYPESLPPLRSDRDSIVVGRMAKGASNLNVAATIGGQPVEWNATATESNEANAYLPELVQQAQRNGGVTLATVGSAGLAEVGRVMNAGFDSLTEMAERAVAAGDLAGAGQIADAVLRRDPGNLRAQTVQRVVQRRGEENPDDLNMIRTAQLEELDAPAAGTGDLFADPADDNEIAVGDPVIIDNFQSPAAAASSPTAPPQAGAMIDDFEFSGEVYPPAGAVTDGVFLDSIERKNKVFAQMLEKEVQSIISSARDIMSSSPDTAIQDLKLAMQSVRNAPELLANVRASLVDRLETALQQASRSAALKTELDRELEEVKAAARERRLLLDRLEQKREREKQLMARFNALMDEKRYIEAQEVASIVEEVDPNGVTPVAAQIWAAHSRAHYNNQVVRAAKAQGYIDALFEVELAHIPIPDNPPIVYPDAEVWRDLTERRQKYKSVDIGSKGDAELRISSALQSPLTGAGLDFTDTPLEEVVVFLRDEYGIEIQLDVPALDDLGLSPDEPITVNLRNISLRSALRLMLKQLELTYMIADEVLLITTEEEAETRLTVKVYPVGDLVIDKTPLVGGGGGGQLGGGGGGGGLGGGGGGGLGGGGGGGLGGGGGGGFGGGGGGGAFSLPEEVPASEPAEVTSDLVLTKRTASTIPAKKPTAQAEVSSLSPATQAQASKATAKAKLPKIDTSVAPAKFWDDYFAANQADPAVVRKAVRKLMKNKRYDHVESLIYGALRHGQARPWMYETLGISLQLSGKSPVDVERAIMSAVDFTTSPDQLMVIAQYLLSLEHDLRAIQVYQQVVKIDPLRHEAYVLGLRAAERSGDQDGIRWATVGILSQEWPESQAAISKTAMRLAKATLRQLKGFEKTEYQREIDQALSRDCLIRISWTGNADVDLIVKEPTGTVCSQAQARTIGGGVSLGDDFAAGSDPSNSGFKETYVCPKGFSGQYQAHIRRVWGDITADRVTVDVYTNYGSADEQHLQKQVELTEEDAIVVFDLNEGRREEPLEEQQLAMAINRQQAMSQAVLAQQLSSLADPRVNTDRPADRLRRQRLLGGRGAVGFQPVIIQLPDGTNFTVNAVASADRRYVIVRPSPVFSTIGDVSTFSFTSGGGGDNGAGGQAQTQDATATASNNITIINQPGGAAPGGDGGDGADGAP